MNRCYKVLLVFRTDQNEFDFKRLHNTLLNNTDIHHSVHRIKVEQKINEKKIQKSILRVCSKNLKKPLN